MGAKNSIKKYESISESSPGDISYKALSSNEEQEIIQELQQKSDKFITLYTTWVNSRLDIHINDSSSKRISGH